MTITISKKEIFDEVEKRSSLEGSVLPERFEGVWASEEEGKFLDSYWLEGYTAVVQLLKRYLKSSTLTYELNKYNKDEVLTIEAEMPERYNSLLDGSVATDVKMMIACNVLHGWLEVKAPDAAVKYEEESKGYSEDLRVKLLWRAEPDAKFSQAKDDVENLGNGDGEGVLSQAKDDTENLGNGDVEGGGEGLVKRDFADCVVMNPEWEYMSAPKKDFERMRQYRGCEEKFSDCRTRRCR